MSRPPSRRILLAVVGLSPQIVTETLFALGQQADNEPPPTEIHVVTTTEGARRVRNSLLHADGGQYHALLADYPKLGTPRFVDSHIHLIVGPDGTALADIRSPAENAAAADAITALLAQLTADADSSLHVSIAGGRKTMGFFLGYAFSLFARPQDRLSHVLVSAPFENHPDFFFPPATPRRLATRDGHHLDTADAEVTLAEIPVVRLRHGLPDGLQQGRLAYSETVHALQRSFDPPQLHIDLSANQARCGEHPLNLSPALLAWLAWWADCALRGEPMQTWRDADARRYLALYRRIIGPDAQALENAALRLGNGMEKEFFQQNNAKLEGAIKQQLGPAAHPYLLCSKGQRPFTRRGLSLPKSSIRLVDC